MMSNKYVTAANNKVNCNKGERKSLSALLKYLYRVTRVRARNEIKEKKQQSQETLKLICHLNQVYRVAILLHGNRPEEYR
jgi:hypothetical protein